MRQVALGTIWAALMLAFALSQIIDLSTRMLKPVISGQDAGTAILIAIVGFIGFMAITTERYWHRIW